MIGKLEKDGFWGLPHQGPRVVVRALTPACPFVFMMEFNASDISLITICLSYIYALLSPISLCTSGSSMKYMYHEFTSIYFLIFS